MKNLSLLILAFFCLSTLSVEAQDALKKGMIKMEITEVGSDNPQVAAQLEMMKGTSTEYFFNEDKSLVNSNMMGGMIKMSYLVNNDDEHLTMLFDAMGQKMMIKSTKEERAEFEKEQNAAAESMNITYDESDTKEILGYKCIRADIESDDSEIPMSFTMYVAPDIKASSKMIQGLQAYELKGFPLELIIDSEQMSMTFSTTELKREIDESVFSLNTSGYTEMTFDEFQQQMGAFGGGGMGF